MVKSLIPIPKFSFDLSSKSAAAHSVKAMLEFETGTFYAEIFEVIVRCHKWIIAQSRAES